MSAPTQLLGDVCTYTAWEMIETKVRDWGRQSWHQRPRVERERAETGYMQGQKPEETVPCDGQSKQKTLLATETSYRFQRNKASLGFSLTASWGGGTRTCLCYVVKPCPCRPLKNCSEREVICYRSGSNSQVLSVRYQCLTLEMFTWSLGQ